MWHSRLDVIFQDPYKEQLSLYSISFNGVPNNHRSKAVRVRPKEDIEKGTSVQANRIIPRTPHLRDARLTSVSFGCLLHPWEILREDLKGLEAEADATF